MVWRVAGGNWMKYLHSGYILFCDKADHAEDGRINTFGLFDLFALPSLPEKRSFNCVISYGTPYERRQYKGNLIIEDPEGNVVVNHDFNANDPNDLYKGHYSFPLELNVNKEGLWIAKACLYNWKNENIWSYSREFWAMVERDGPPDP